MRTHIDWLTFTMQLNYSEGIADGYANAIERAFLSTFRKDVVARVFGGNWQKRERSRAPYTDAWVNGEGGISFFASPTLTHSTVEISGAGCEAIIALGAMEDVISAVADRVTRIDIACDIETEIRPSEFVEKLSHERMRASGYQHSDTGETCYVGSQKSDRYARVYRYNKPHPRHKLLRVEHVFRREYAKKVSRAVISGGLESVAAAAGNAFGWAHSDWRPSLDSSIDISITAPERKMGKTVFWLVNSVAPAVRRLIADGTIRDPEAFFREYFTP